MTADELKAIRERYVEDGEEVSDIPALLDWIDHQRTALQLCIDYLNGKSTDPVGAILAGERALKGEAAG